MWPSPCPPFWLCPSQQQRHEDRSHLWVRKSKPSFRIFWLLFRLFLCRVCYVIITPSTVRYDFCVLFLAWVWPTLVPTEKMSCLCFFLSWETPSPAWRSELIFFFLPCFLEPIIQYCWTNLMSVCILFPGGWSDSPGLRYDRCRFL